MMVIEENPTCGHWTVSDRIPPYPPEILPRRFKLVRDYDQTGISGTGTVAWGIEFLDGRVALRWDTPTASTATFDSIDDVVWVHGHEGATRVVWID